MGTLASTLRVGGARRWLGHTARFPLLGLTGLLLVLIVLPFVGLRTLVVRSGSMAPAIRTGDIVVTKVIAPAEAAVGDVVTFRDTSRDGDLVTHRVVDVRQEGGRRSFVTMGDANGGVERWSIAEDGALGKMVFRLPKLGYLVSWAVHPWVRAVLLLGAAAILAAVSLRRIWAT